MGRARCLASLLLVACAAPPAPAAYATPTLPAETAPVPAPVVPVAPPPARRELTEADFYESFLDATDVGERFQGLVAPSSAEGLRRHYRRSQPPDGLRWVADTTWSDPHGAEPLYRIEETGWLFEEEAPASRHVDGVLSRLRKQYPNEDAVGPTFGDDCHLLKAITRTTLGERTFYTYLIRVSRLVVQISFTQGSHAPEGSLTLDLVAPVARRAAERAATPLAKLASP